MAKSKVASHEPFVMTEVPDQRAYRPHVKKCLFVFFFLQSLDVSVPSPPGAEVKDRRGKKQLRGRIRKVSFQISFFS